MQKEYKFSTILEEYNKIHGRKLELSSNISTATVFHNIDTDLFSVVFTLSTRERGEYTLYDFIYNYSCNVDIRYFKDIIYSEEKEVSKLIIKIWPPNKIMYAYLKTNYFSGAGILGNSCMRYRDNQKSLNFYVKNNIRIVVLVDDKNKIHGRALLWDNVNSTKRKTPFTYLDRVYTNSELFVSQFYDLANENKWKRYISTSVGDADKSYYKENIYTTNIFYFPYADTFRYLYYKDSVIMSNPGSIKVKDTNHISLIQTSNGGYAPELDPNKVREALTCNFISKKDAIFVKRYKAWVSKTNIADINGAYYSVYDKDITKTTMDGWILKKNSVSEVFTNEAIDVTKAVKSAKYNGHVHKSNILYIENDLYHKLDTDVVCFKNKWYHTSQCFVNYNQKKANEALTKMSFHFWIDNEVFVPYPDDSITREEENLIPKKYATIAYNLIYNPVVDDIEYQAVYLTSARGLIRLVTGEFVIDSSANRKYLKRFNNKYYVKRDSELPDKNQLLLFK